jgi:Family of unknown function (DUF6262)
MTPERTAAAIEARRRVTAEKLQQVRDAVSQLRRRKTRVTYPAVARAAGVSRTFLYANPGARALIDAATSNSARTSVAPGGGGQEPSWRERALNAEAALKTAETEITAQRRRMAILLGQIRDLERDVPAEAAQRLTTENTTLRQRVRELASESKTLAERLEAARSNSRFADRRIAQLEAQLAGHATAR